MPDSFEYGATTAEFDVLLDGREYHQEAEVHELRVPWGSTVVTQRTGTGLPHLRLDAYCATQAQVDDLIGGLGAAGTLTYWGGTHTAILRDAAEVNWWDPEHRRLRLEFIVTA